MSGPRRERFESRWDELAVEATVQVPPEATIGAQTIASDVVEASDSLPKISLGSSTGRGDAVASGSTPPDLELGRTLGEGGMGRVHEAHQRSLRRHVAVKTLKPGASVQSREALLIEARVTGFLEHPGIIPVHSLGLDDAGNPVLVMKRVQGVPWSELVENNDHPMWDYWLARHGDGLLAHLEILSQVCDALHFAHSKGIIHRDVKPENVMLGTFGEVYLVDWGLAVRNGDDAVGQLVGTPAFMAPEMALGEAVDARTDVYLLGATLHQILTGAFLHEGKNLRELLWAATESKRFDYPESVPAELAMLAGEATRRDSAERPASAEHVRLAIASYLGHRSSVVVSDAAAERLRQGETVHGNEELAPEERAYHLATHCAEARFGFEQALKTWPENAEASRGLERCKELQIQAHLLRRDLLAATTQFAELEVARPELAGAIDALRDELDREREEHERLQRMEEEFNPQAGLGQRVRAFLVICAGVFSVSVYFAVWGNASELTNRDTVYVGLAIVGIGVGYVVARWRRLMVNAFSRRIVALVMIGFFTILANRLVGWYESVPVHYVFTMDLLMIASLTALGGAAITRWMIPMSVVAFAGVVALLWAPSELGPGVFSGFASACLVVGGLSWYRDQRGLWPWNSVDSSR